MPGSTRAFISYAHRYGDWVEALRRDLIATLELADARAEVFLDRTDLGAGHSWVGQLQAGLDRAERLILVVTPEALASPRVRDEWQSFVALQTDWHGRLQLVHLVDAPLPPFLADVHFADFRDAGAGRYRRGLAALAAGLLGRSGDAAGAGIELPAALEAPASPAADLPPATRSRLVEHLAPLLGRRFSRRGVAAALGLPRTALDGYPSAACAASAALVRHTGDDDPVRAARRVVEVLAEELKEDEPEWVEALAPLREELAALRQGGGLLAAYRQRVAADHDRLVPYFQQKVELDSLARVYVQLELQPDAVAALARARSGRPGKAAAEGLQPPAGPLGIRALLALDRDAHPWVTRRWAVRGDPGAGKTTMLRHLAATLAREGGDALVPVFESLPRWMREPQWLIDRLERRLGRGGHRGLGPLLEQLGREGRLLVLLDGLDEVPEELRDEAEGQLRDLAARWPETPIVVSSRPIGYRRPGRDFVEVDLLPLNRSRRHRFLAKWFGRTAASDDEARADRALAVLDGDPGLRELASNPLYLTLMALLLEQGHEPSRHRGELYRQVFELLLEGKHRAAGQPMPHQNLVRAALRHLAYAMTEDDRDAEPVVDLEARLYQPACETVCRDLERRPQWRRNLRLFLDEVASKTGILGPHDGPDADWRFWHRTFREALAAEQLAARWRAEGETAILEHAAAIAGDLSRWAEPYALLAARVDDPDALVSALVAANRALGLRALATAQGLHDETVVAVLGLTEKWQERAEVYRRIPDLVGDAERALALIDRLRRRTRDGNDLYFLHAAVGASRRRWPDHRPRADHVLARFYDHVPKPDEDLFRWIETPKDGRVALWAEVPEGTFWMGSEKGKGHSDEQPQHQVTIASPFRIGVVPVTIAQYRAFDPDHQPHLFKEVPDAERPFHPVQGVTWYQAVSFCRWLRAAFPWARGARLALEEEWEYACRAGTETAYWPGDEEADLEKVGWYGEGPDGRTHRVGEKPANAWGLYDVHGNVWEWTASPWTDDYAHKRNSVTIDPSKAPEIVPATLAGDESGAAEDEAAAEAPGGARRVIRGGSYWGPADWARAAYRNHGDPGFGVWDRGFRVVLPPRAGPRG